MPRIYFLQHWFNLSDPAVEEALYDSRAMRAFAGIDLGREGVPDETTVCKFRHLLERHGLGERIFALVNAHLTASGLTLSRGSIVDAHDHPCARPDEEQDPDARPRDGEYESSTRCLSSNEYCGSRGRSAPRIKEIPSKGRFGSRKTARQGCTRVNMAFDSDGVT